MQLGMVGLGRMGANMAERLRLGAHDVIGYDRDPSVSQTASLEDLVAKLGAPRAVWVMVPSGAPTEDTVARLGELCAPGDVVIDGGNSNFRDSIRRAAALKDKGIDFLDAGTSGGIWGLAEGFCLMVGGDANAFAKAEPLFATLAPPDGYLHAGPSGAGHYVKMIHNGIEYALLQAYAEGFEILSSSRTFPDLDLAGIAELWRHGSVVRSWLLDLAARALAADPKLDDVRGWVADSGEGRWTILEAIDSDVPVPAIAASLFARFASRQDDSFAMKMIAALRKQFGGHAVRSE
jgi:6-phosphogluconate dehydrogenase